MLAHIFLYILKNDVINAFSTFATCAPKARIHARERGMRLELNTDLANEPEAVNNDPYGKGWMVKMTVDNPADVAALLDAVAYEAVVG